MRPVFESKTPPPGIRQRMRDAVRDAQEDGPLVPEIAVEAEPPTLLDHIFLNSDRYRARFSNYQPTPGGFLLRDPTDPASVLPASAVNTYQVVIPHLYRLDGIVRDITQEELFARLASIDSEIHHSIVPPGALSNCTDRCRRTLAEPVTDEACLRRHVTGLITQAACMITPASEFAISQDEEALSGASGVLCVLNQTEDDFERNSGFAGCCDVIYDYGKPPQTPGAAGGGGRRQGAFCAIELKPDLGRVNFANVPYYHQGGALFAQTLQSLIGHRAEFALSITARGLKVFVMDVSNLQTTGEVNFSKWPEGNEFFNYRAFANAPITAKLFLQIARISLKKLPEPVDDSSPLKASTQTNKIPPLTEQKPVIRHSRSHPTVSSYYLRSKNWQEAPADFQDENDPMPVTPEDVVMWAWAEEGKKKLFFTSLDMDARFPDSATRWNMRTAELECMEDDFLEDLLLP